MTVCLGVLAAAGLAEVALRIVGYSSPQFYEADSVLGYRLIPGVQGTYAREGKSYVRINADGYNAPEFAVDKPAGVYRVAVVGDSYVEALQVAQNESFVNFLGSTMSACSFGRVEILPFGVSGYGTAQELLTYRAKVARYRPDLVLLLVTTNNDITDNSAALKRTAIPYFALEDGRLVPDDSFLADKGFQWRDSRAGHFAGYLENDLRLVQGIRAGIAAAKSRYRAWKFQNSAADPGNGSAAVTEIGIDNQIYLPPADQVWNGAWDVTEALISEFRTEVEANGSRFVVVTGSNGVQVLPDPTEKARYAAQLGIPDLFYPDRRIQAFCRTQSIRSIELAPVLSEIAEREHTYLHGFPGDLGYGHWNQLGHKAAGNAIGNALCSMDGLNR